MRKLIQNTRVVFLLSIFTFVGSLWANTCKQEAPFVSEVYPSTNKLPENLLRFYIYFSKPMQRENILDSISLQDPEGNVIEGAFLNNRYNLWSPDSRRLTLLFDPGRVKTGLVAHNTFGRALDVGKKYHLVINSKAKDYNNCTLKKEFVKKFEVIKEDLSSPNVNNWKLNLPNAGTKESLFIDLDGVVDHISLAYRIRIKDLNNNILSGKIDLSNNEKQWIFTPTKAWNKSKYKLVVNPVLEDIAGNRTSGLFDQPSLVKESQAQDKFIIRTFDLKNPQN